MTVQDYLDLITSEFALQPNYTAMVGAMVSPQVQVQQLLASMIPLFDLDVAVGNQLDIIGQWVGVSREIDTPISGVFFTWDDVDATGWDYGIWFDPSEPGAITILPDDVYRTLIRARIAANHWDGTTEGSYAVFDAVFPDLQILIIDHQNMSYSLAIVGRQIDSLTLALIQGGYLNVKPEGVRVAEYIVAPNAGPLFAWDLDTEFLQGWDEGSWGIELTPS